MTIKKKIALEASSPLWEDVYGIEKGRIAKILRSNFIDCYHIGSTAIPSIQARPVIDTLCVVHTMKGITLFTNEFERFGFVQSDRYVGKKRLFYIHKAKDGTPLSYLHIVEKTSTLVGEYLDFTRHLSGNTELASEYEKIRHDLLAEHGVYNEDYEAGKKDFFKKVQSTCK